MSLPFTPQTPSSARTIDSGYGTLAHSTLEAALLACKERLSATRLLVLTVFRDDLLVPFVPIRKFGHLTHHPIYEPPNPEHRLARESSLVAEAQRKAESDPFAGKVLERISEVAFELTEAAKSHASPLALIPPSAEGNALAQFQKQTDDLTNQAELVVLFTANYKIMAPFFASPCLHPGFIEASLERLAEQPSFFTKSIEGFTQLKKFKGRGGNIVNISADRVSRFLELQRTLCNGLNKLLNHVASENLYDVIREPMDPNPLPTNLLATAKSDAYHYLDILCHLSNRAQVLLDIHGGRVDAHVLELHHNSPIPTFILGLYSHSLLLAHAAGFTRDFVGLDLTFENLQRFGITRNKYNDPFDQEHFTMDVSYSIGSQRGSVMTHRQRHRYARSRLVQHLQGSEQ